jgi:hypothetical protein
MVIDGLVYFVQTYTCLTKSINWKAHVHSIKNCPFDFLNVNSTMHNEILIEELKARTKVNI